MATFFGKVFKAGLNSITPKYPLAWADPANTGFKKFLNGTQWQDGNSMLFQYGLKHKIVEAGYSQSLRKYCAMSSHGDLEEMARLKGNVPRALQQAFTELAHLNASGATKIMYKG